MIDGIAFVDGGYCSLLDAKISVFDPGFVHSDVVYDVTSTWKGRFFRLDDHVERFAESCRGFKINSPYEGSALKRILAECVRRGRVEDGAYVACVAARGRYIDEKAELSRDITRTRPTFIAYAVSYRYIFSPEQQERGVHLIVAKTPRIPDACIDARFKNYHWGDLTKGKWEAKAAGADVAVLPSVEGYLTEAAGANVFFTRKGILCTPARNILRGVTRQSAIDIATEFGIPVEVGDFHPDALREAEEAFVTSTAGGIMPVSKIEGRDLPDGRPGPITMKIRSTYWRKREDGWLGTPVADLLGG